MALPTSNRAAAMTGSRGFTFVQLLLALAVIGCLMVLPAIVAARVHASRIRRAQAQVDALATRLRGATMAGVGVLAGPGGTPAAPDDARWISGTRTVLSTDATPDPWGNQLLVNAGTSGRLCVLSAGANGIIETPFDDATAPHGDDITAPVVGGDRR